ncbi:H-NS family nucleoid-associated regulatory protein [Paraburkholderia sp. BL25I1N1]|uniref:H-NS family nucleoid-associated regulatory protein n=1 Tax=Paraburkholderia sp. BL25I1N1 TaxID=1938804 RepID=UPI000D049DA1|nr:H-NS family nucleoid-associated regulatory protein [Paraburkholderia sp. BL25I1N1]PRY06004.1 DNA-binding protein H-NS [Paraburkholderia sp. BL25I1N1]
MATLEQIQARVKKLQAQAEALLAKKTQAAVDQIRKLMLDHGLTTEDIEAKAAAKRAAKGMRVSATGKTKTTAADKAKAAPKYLNPKTGATWTGHGRAPTWIAEAKDRSKFLIAGGAETTVAATKETASKAKTAGKKAASKSVGATVGMGQRKGPQPALYRDPMSGATWSGRGPAPAWLAGAKDRSKFLIDGNSTAADAKPVVKKAAVKKAPPAKKTAAKKAIAKKAVVTKVEATKTAPKKKVAMKKTVAKKAVNATAPAKKALRKNAAVTAPVATVESAAESTT